MRCAHVSAIHAYLANNVVGALQPDELLRAEWAMRVSALDLFIHELVAQRMGEIFDGVRPTTPAFVKFKVSADTLARIRLATSPVDASAAFDLEVREELGRRTFQFPDDIADAIRLISSIELWNGIAIHLGATPATKVREAKSLRQSLSLIVARRNKIVHEGDLSPMQSRAPWPVSQADLLVVMQVLEQIVRTIDHLV